MTFKEKKNTNFLVILVALVIIIGIGFIFISPMFEKNPPKIAILNKTYWNLKDPIKINLSDDSGIKYYKVTLYSGKNSKVIEEKVLNSNEKNLTLTLKAPNFDLFFKAKNLKLEIIAIDNSKWNFFNGNESKKEKFFKIDTKKPHINIIANSRYIRRGGSAVAIVKIEDKNLQNYFIDFNGNIFKLTPFLKPNYYIALIAWDINIKFKDFNKVKVVAIDKAGNKAVSKIPFYIQNLKIKKDKIKISDKFIDNVSQYVLEQMGKNVPNDPIEVFLAENKLLRKENIKKLREIGLKAVPKDYVDEFKINRFKRLRGSRTAARYGEFRSYYYNGKLIDQEWHLGYDFASVKHAKIRVSNSGKVIFKDYLGIYGNIIIVDHGLGLCSLYAHTSDQFVNVGDNVKKGQVIGLTGTSGAVLGDHLHFGILIQGIEVNPIEWMDSRWIKTRIVDVIKRAKREIK